MENLGSYTHSRSGDALFVITAYFQANDPIADELTLVATSLDGRDELGRASWALEPAPEGGYQLRLISDPILTAGCVVICLGKAFAGAGPTVECLRNAKTVQQARNCLIGVTGRLVETGHCVLECLSP